MTLLTDEQVCDELLTPRETSVQTADAEVVALRSALGSYRDETLQWAERRSATQPSLVPAAKRSERWAALPRWSLATIAIVTIAAGAAHLSEERADLAESTSAQPMAAAQETRSTPAEIAADNKLLNSIDAELSYHTQSPVDAFDLKAPAASASRQRTSGGGSEE